MFTVINTAAMGSTGVVMCCILHSPEHQLVHLQQAAVLERGALSVVNEIVNLIFFRGSPTANYRAPVFVSSIARYGK